MGNYGGIWISGQGFKLSIQAYAPTAPATVVQFSKSAYDGTVTGYDTITGTAGDTVTYVDPAEIMLPGVEKAEGDVNTVAGPRPFTGATRTLGKIGVRLANDGSKQYTANTPEAGKVTVTWPDGQIQTGLIMGKTTDNPGNVESGREVDRTIEWQMAGLLAGKTAAP